jgi:aspartate carbamoyltransferase catalytic subunit
MFGANVTLVSPEALRMDEDIIAETKQKFGTTISQTSEINLHGQDVLYVCRIQKERFSDQYEAEKMQKGFRIDLEVLKGADSDLAILHPLPKVDEIPPEVDSDPRAKYFEQAKNGVPVRMAVLYLASKG